MGFMRLLDTVLIGKAAALVVKITLSGGESGMCRVHKAVRWVQNAFRRIVCEMCRTLNALRHTF